MLRREPLFLLSTHLLLQQVSATTLPFLYLSSYKIEKVAHNTEPAELMLFSASCRDLGIQFRPLQTNCLGFPAETMKPSQVTCDTTDFRPQSATE